MSKNKNLLNENTIRRMMKLASVDSLSDSFISSKYSPLSESVEEETVEEGTKKDDELKDDEGGRGEKKGDKAYVNEEEAAEEMEDAMDSMDDAEDKMDDAIDDAEAAEDEVTLTDDEARDIIALADKLRSAMGGEEEPAEEPEMDMDMAADEGGEEMEMDAEMEEEPGMRYDMMEEEENLYEAALSNLDINIVEEKEIQLENLKKQIYKKVINRLLKESKK
jgi:hypothetical protein